MTSKAGCLVYSILSTSLDSWVLRFWLGLGGQNDICRNPWYLKGLQSIVSFLKLRNSICGIGVPHGPLSCSCLAVEVDVECSDIHIHFLEAVHCKNPKQKLIHSLGNVSQVNCRGSKYKGYCVRKSNNIAIEITFDSHCIACKVSLAGEVMFGISELFLPCMKEGLKNSSSIFFICNPKHILIIDNSG